jgi:uncharacterized membrane protein YfcA
MGAGEVVAATLVVVVGACVQGSMGFGLGLLSAPLLALVEPDLVPGPVIFASLPLSLLVAWRERASFDLGEVRWAVTGRLPGTVAGAFAVAALPDRGLALLFGVVVLGAVGLSVAGWDVRPTAPTLVAAGAASGFMGTATSIGGPPIALVYQHSTGPRLRSILATYFVFGALFSLGSLTAFGEFARRELGLGLWLLPGMAVGYLLSRVASRYLDRGRTRLAVLVSSSVSAVVLLVVEVL